MMLRQFLLVLREDGAAGLLRRAWGSSTSFGLRCDLTALPDRGPARIPIVMTPAASAADAGLLAELLAAGAGDRPEAEHRVELCDAGVERLYVARDESGAPVYAQWLLGPGQHAAIDAVNPGLFPAPAPGQVLVEGAYTYVAFRGVGAMRDGMHQLLAIARDEAFTYVSSDYIPSIRGCANVGFELDHLRVSTRRLLRRTIAFVPAGDDAMVAWKQATAPRATQGAAQERRRPVRRRRPAWLTLLSRSGER